jgi:hypothetical protein
MDSLTILSILSVDSFLPYSRFSNYKALPQKKLKMGGHRKYPRKGKIVMGSEKEVACKCGDCKHEWKETIDTSTKKVVYTQCPK